MKQIKILTISTVVLNALILIGAGHGISFLIMTEILGFKFLFTEFSEIDIFGSYDEKLVPIAIVSLIFQTVLIVSLFQKKIKEEKFCSLLLH